MNSDSTRNRTNDFRGESQDARDQLPPVRPPEARFLMQLFVTPLLIVAVIVGAFFLVTWLAQPHERPDVLVDGIERLDHRSWQQALALANQLRGDSAGELRTNRPLAQRLANVLERQTQLKTQTNDRVRLQVYLCRALGEFEADTGLATLAEVASPEPAWKDPIVRRAALQAMGLLTDRIGAEAITSSPAAMRVLREAAQQVEEPSEQTHPGESLRLRSTAVYVLGLVGGEAAEQQLASLLDDPDVHVRFNATTGLARSGNVRSLPLLRQMLDWSPDYEASANQNVTQDELRQERDLVVSAAIRAIATLAARYPTLDLDELREPVAAIMSDSTVGRLIRDEAKELIRLLDGD